MNSKHPASLYDQTLWKEFRRRKDLFKNNWPTLFVLTKKIAYFFLRLPRRMRAILPRMRYWLIKNAEHIYRQKVATGEIAFYCSNETTLLRAKTVLTKEPGTITWINNFAPGSVFWDIGANIGVFSLYAAKCSDATVLSFEPLHSNFTVLMRNIALNKFASKIYGFYVALADKDGCNSFYVRNDDSGYSGNSFAKPIGIKGETYKYFDRPLVLGTSIDSLIERYNAPFPSYIKIDVDGIEDKIIAGAKRTLVDKRLKSVLVELDKRRADYDVVISTISDAGFQLTEEEKTSRSSSKPCYNHIFVRSDAKNE